MARSLRIELAGGWYHVTVRGANRQDIFRSDFDRRHFLKLLGLAHQRHRLEVHAYCLMTNHVHLLVRTPEPNLAKVMQLINGTYAQFFNRLNGRTGPLFDGRYFSSLIDSKAYLTAAASYIHRNPVAAGLIDRARDWPWSSQRAYVRLSRTPRWLILDEVLRGYADEAEYESVVDRPTAEADRYRTALDGCHPIIGTDAFVANALDGVEIQAETVSAKNRLEVRPDIKLVEQSILTTMGVDAETLTTSRRGMTNLARAFACFFAFDVAGLPLAEVAERYGFESYKGASASNERLKKRMSSDSEIRALVDALRQSFARGSAAA